MSIILQTPSNGSITLSEQNTASNITVTIPATTGTLLTTATAGVPIGGPAFSAYQSSAQSLSTSTWTKIQFQSEDFDTNNCFDSTTNYRFTPTVAGYYGVTAGVVMGVSASTVGLAFYKNGSEQRRVQFGSTTISASSGAQLTYMNGTTDYLEAYALVGTAQTLATGSAFTFFQAYLARSAT